MEITVEEISENDYVSLHADFSDSGHKSGTKLATYSAGQLTFSNKEDIVENSSASFQLISASDDNTSEEKCLTWGDKVYIGLQDKFEEHQDLCGKFGCNIGSYDRDSSKFEFGIGGPTPEAFSLVPPAGSFKSKTCISNSDKISLAYGGKNIALGKPATAASLYEDHEITPLNDGSVETLYHSHGNTHGANWVEVDLQGVFQIDSFEVHNRHDCCQERIVDFKLIILASDRTEMKSFHYSEWNSVQLLYQKSLNAPVYGQYVRVELATNNFLQISELKVFGSQVVSPQDSSLFSFSSSHSSTHRSGWLDSDKSWSVGSLVVGEYYQIDIGSLQKVAGVITQGRNPNPNDGYGYGQSVTSYTVEYSNDLNSWQKVNDDFIFTGNYDSTNHKVTNKFSPVLARYVRIYPQTWKNHMSMRAGVLLSD
eukprot:Awhi_evm1s1199